MTGNKTDYCRCTRAATQDNPKLDTNAAGRSQPEGKTSANNFRWTQQVHRNKLKYASEAGNASKKHYFPCRHEGKGFHEKIKSAVSTDVATPISKYT